VKRRFVDADKKSKAAFVNVVFCFQRSVAPDAEEPFQQALPYELYLHIFSFLTAREIIPLLRVNKVWLVALF